MFKIAHTQTEATCEVPEPTKPPLRLKDGRLMVTPELAGRLLAEANYSRQRRLDENHAHVLSFEMQHGLFTPGTQLHFALLDRRYHCIDGQHRLRGVERAQTPVEFSILVTEVKDEAELNALYYRHDVVTRKRSWGDVVRAADVGELREVTNREAEAVLAAMVPIACGFKAPKASAKAVEFRSPDRRFEAARHWWTTAKQFLAAIDNADTRTKKALLRQPVMSVGLMTFKYQAEIAREFWEGVARDDGLRQEDPRKTLLKYLAERSIGGGNSAAEMMRGVASAWNAFYEKRRLKFIRVSTDMPMVIIGTPVGRRKAE